MVGAIFTFKVFFVVVRDYESALFVLIVNLWGIVDLCNVFLISRLGFGDLLGGI